MKKSLLLHQNHTFLIVPNGKAQILNLRNIKVDIHMDQKAEFSVRLFMLKHLSSNVSTQEFRKSISVGGFWWIRYHKEQRVVKKKLQVSSRFVFFINQKWPET